MHILENTVSEIEISKRNLENIPFFSKENYFFFLKNQPFLTAYKSFSIKKEEILLLYSSLYSDIKKDTGDTTADASDIDDVRESLIHITEGIERLSDCIKTLSQKNDFERNILEHETTFFEKLLFSFNDDVRAWLKHNSQEISQEIETIDHSSKINTLAGAKEILLLHKKRLESYRENIAKI